MGQRALIRFWHAHEGTTAVEYAVLVSLLLLASIGGINTLAQGVARPIQSTSQQIEFVSGGGVRVNSSRKVPPAPKSVRTRAKGERP